MTAPRTAEALPCVFLCMSRSLLVFVLAALLPVGCSERESTVPTSGGIETTTDRKLASQQVPVPLSKCRIRAGGHDVRVHGLDCGEADALVGTLGVRDLATLRTPVNTSPEADLEQVYRVHGWTCWVSFVLIGNGRPASGIKHVCSSGERLLLFTFS